MCTCVRVFMYLFYFVCSFVSLFLLLFVRCVVVLDLFRGPVVKRGVGWGWKLRGGAFSFVFARCFSHPGGETNDREGERKEWGGPNEYKIVTLMPVYLQYCTISNKHDMQNGEEKKSNDVKRIKFQRAFLKQTDCIEPGFARNRSLLVRARFANNTARKPAPPPSKQ